MRVGSDGNRDNEVCGEPITMSQITAGQKIEVECNLEGRYLSVEVPGEGKFLQLCEVRAVTGQCASGRCRITGSFIDFARGQMALRIAKPMLAILSEGKIKRLHTEKI